MSFHSFIGNFRSRIARSKNFFNWIQMLVSEHRQSALTSIRLEEFQCVERLHGMMMPGPSHCISQNEATSWQEFFKVLASVWIYRLSVEVMSENICIFTRFMNSILHFSALLNFFFQQILIIVNWDVVTLTKFFSYYNSSVISIVQMCLVLL